MGDISAYILLTSCTLHNTGPALSCTTNNITPCMEETAVTATRSKHLAALRTQCGKGDRVTEEKGFATWYAQDNLNQGHCRAVGSDPLKVI